MEDHQLEQRVNSLGDWKEESEYDIICPLLPSHGKPNLTKEACEVRQRTKHMKTCYGGCYLTRKPVKQKEKRVRLKAREVVKQGKKWLKRNQNGEPERVIAASVGCSTSKVHRWMEIARQHMRMERQ